MARKELQGEVRENHVKRVSEEITRTAARLDLDASAIVSAINKPDKAEILFERPYLRWGTEAKVVCPVNRLNGAVNGEEWNRHMRRLAALKPLTDAEIKACEGEAAYK